MGSIKEILISHVQHYNHKKYWKYRKIVIDKENKTNKFIKIFYLYKIKKMDAFNNASFGTHLNYGAYFSEPPKLPHGIRGIFISHNVKVGKNSTIFHHVTIGEGNGGAPTIGDNCIIGAGAKIIRWNKNWKQCKNRSWMRSSGRYTR